MYMHKKQNDGEIRICISKYKNKNKNKSISQIFGNLGAVINGLLRSIKRFPSAL